MRITNFDTDLLILLLHTKEATTTELAHAVTDPKGNYELRKADNKIRYRLERMLKKDLLLKNGSKYSPNPKRVFLTNASILLHQINTSVPMGKMLVVYPKDDEIMMRTVELDKNLQNHS